MRVSLRPPWCSVGLGGLLLCVLFSNGLWAGACQFEEPVHPPPRVLYKHIVGPCTFQERTALALSSEEVLKAFEKGYGVDLQGVVMNGDLSLDRLPLHPISHIPISSSPIKRKLEEQGIEEVRVISGPIFIRESWVQGLLATHLKKGAFLVFGPVDLSKTTFQTALDFSRTIFLDTVNLSGTTISAEGFFIRSHFEKFASFHQTGFGTHTRFHQAYFGEHVTFDQAGFHGLAEFLEVVFANQADFSETLFKLGTGFSGSQFRGGVDFSHALFEREAYFRFANFQKKTSFKEATFREVADFTNVQFGDNPDFSKTTFRIAPEAGESKKYFENRIVRKKDLPTSQMIIFVGLFLLVGFFIWRLRKLQP